jgi:hypothetical protein
MMKAGNRILLFFVFMLLQATGNAQAFAWKAKLEAVPQTGFYRIPLSQDWLWRVKADLSDVRIQGGQGVAVPFLVEPSKIDNSLSFIDFPVLGNTTDTAVTTLELDAGKHQGTSRIDLVMGNTAVERRASLSGSNDRRQWFIIDENLQLTNVSGNTSGQFVQSLQFPFVEYHYLKLQIRNKGTDPLPVIKAGLFVDTIVKAAPEMLLNSGTAYRQVDSSDGQSYVWVHCLLPYPVDKISLQLSGTKFYQRNVQVYKVENGKARALLIATELRSGSEASIWLPAMKAKDFLISIENGDNPPLQIASVNTFTRQHGLVAYLEKGKEYMLVGGNQNTSLPQYDLAYFRDSIPASLPVLAYDQVQQNTGPLIAATAISQWWIWPAIVLMVLILTAVTLRMVKEARKEEA